MEDYFNITRFMVHPYATTDDVHAVVEFLCEQGHSVAANFDEEMTNSDFIQNHPVEYAAIQAALSEAIDFAARKNRWGKE